MSFKLALCLRRTGIEAVPQGTEGQRVERCRPARLTIGFQSLRQRPQLHAQPDPAISLIEVNRHRVSDRVTKLGLDAVE